MRKLLPKVSPRRCVGSGRFSCRERFDSSKFEQDAEAEDVEDENNSVVSLNDHDHEAEFNDAEPNPEPETEAGDATPVRLV